ncbi:MAG TPA: hypothetical protein ENN40_04860 [Candidatus Aminicenantes bacterium]|nr:hypothetical protein [Candidatus Aminicenantes bacterium]
MLVVNKKVKKTGEVKWPAVWSRLRFRALNRRDWCWTGASLVVQWRQNSWIGVILHAVVNGPGFIAIALGVM